MASKGDSSEVEVELGPENRQSLFLVEKLIGKREAVDGTTEYRVKWKGYPQNESTWEPEFDLKMCHVLLAENEKKLEAQTLLDKVRSREIIKFKKKIFNPNNVDPNNIVNAKKIKVTVDIKASLVSKSALVGKEVEKLKKKKIGATFLNTPVSEKSSKVNEKAETHGSGNADKAKEVPLSSSSTGTQEKAKVRDVGTPEILKLTRFEGELQYFVKWDGGEVNMILANEANVKWPQAVIAFHVNKYIQHFLPDPEDDYSFDDIDSNADGEKRLEQLREMFERINSPPI